MTGESESWWVWCLETEASDKLEAEASSKLEGEKAVNSRKLTYIQRQEICLTSRVEDYVNTKAEASSKFKGIPGLQWNGTGKKPTVLHGRNSRGRRRPKAKSYLDTDLEKTAFKFEIQTNMHTQEHAYVPEKKPSPLTKNAKTKRKSARKRVFCSAKQPQWMNNNNTSTEYTKPSKHQRSQKKVLE